GVVGRDGLGKLLSRLPRAAPGGRVHLLGHSFGARLVSFALSGLPANMTQTKSPVKSLFLLQGAFSHYAFADELPHDRTRSGALKGMAARVDGPLLTTQSLRDYAVGVSYPAASIVNNEDAAAFDSPSARWGAMGHDGAQAVKATTLPLSAPRGTYPFSKGGWLNLDGNEVIIHGSLPSGAHTPDAGRRGPTATPGTRPRRGRCLRPRGSSSGAAADGDVHTPSTAAYCRWSSRATSGAKKGKIRSRIQHPTTPSCLSCRASFSLACATIRSARGRRIASTFPNTFSTAEGRRLRRCPATIASSSASDAPCPPAGLMAWAASPRSITRPRCQVGSGGTS